MILIDTHALIWLIESDPRLGRLATAIIDEERGGDGVMIAPISVWEVAMLVDKRKVGLSRAVLAWFEAVLADPGFHLTELTPAMAVDAGTLPGAIHGDPADRLIIATARALDCPVLTADRKILDYADTRNVRIIDARR